MITARGLSKRFGQVDAVHEVDLDIGEGSLVGFLGPNGAGKTTTLRMLATLLRPTAGEATVAGCDLRTDPAGVRRRIGYVGQGNGGGLDQRVREELVLQGRFHGLAPAVAARRADELLDRFELGPLAARVTATLSGGQKRRLDLALGLIHQPSLIFLDEPSTGLDPTSRAALWEHIRALRVTVLLSTHYLDEADALCDQLLIIDHGRIAAAGSPDALRDKVSGDLVVLDVSDPARTASLAENLPGATGIAVDDTAVRFRVPHGNTALPALLRELDLAAVSVESIRTHRPTLDDVFHTVTGRTLTEVPA